MLITTDARMRPFFPFILSFSLFFFLCFFSQQSFLFLNLNKIYNMLYFFCIAPWMFRRPLTEYQNNRRLFHTADGNFVGKLPAVVFFVWANSYSIDTIN